LDGHRNANHIPDYIRSDVTIGDESEVNKRYEDFRKYKVEKASKTRDRELNYKTKGIKNQSSYNFYKKDDKEVRSGPLSRSIVDFKNRSENERQLTLHVVLFNIGTIRKV
jgi:hypothetical protein